MHDRRTPPPRPPRMLAAAMLVVAATIAACGASTPDASSSTTLAFSNCIRVNGVPNFPDLSSSGMRIEGTGQVISVNGVSVNASAFLTARQKCERDMPHARASQTQSAQQTQRGLRFARCMRSHGVLNFPDPKTITGHGGNQEVYLPGVNFESPAVQSAGRACGGGPKGP